MKREWISVFSEALSREMHMLVYGEHGTPLLAFPCQDGMCDNWESFQMPETLADFIDGGRIQLFCVDTVDAESFSARGGDPAHRAQVQEQYYRFIVEEVVPLIHERNSADALPVLTGCSLGASHAAICFFRRPDLFAGVLGMSGCYDTVHFWDGWCDSTLYHNSPVHFLPGLPAEHPYLSLYNQRKIILCVGQGRWEREGQRTTALLRDILQQKGVAVWADFWGYDVDHDWPWWKKQIRYFLPFLLGENQP